MGDKHNAIQVNTCPFCGGDAQVKGIWNSFYVQCVNEKCKALAPSPFSTQYTMEEAIAFWNNRRAKDVE